MTAAPGPSRGALIAGFATIYLVWGSTYLGIRVAVESLPPFLMASFRFLVAGGALLAWLRLRGEPWPTFAQWRVNAIIGIFLLLGGNGGVTWAEQFVPSGITALIIALILAVLLWKAVNRSPGVLGPRDRKAPFDQDTDGDANP